MSSRFPKFRNRRFTNNLIKKEFEPYFTPLRLLGGFCGGIYGWMLVQPDEISKNILLASTGFCFGSVFPGCAIVVGTFAMMENKKKE